MPNLTKIEREWGMRLARQLLDGEVSLKFADDDIRGFNITRIDMIGFVLKVGGFEIQGAASRNLNDAQSTKIVPYAPEDKQTSIILIAQKQRKHAVLYKHTGWERCRDLAISTERDAMIGSDLGL